MTIQSLLYFCFKLQTILQILYPISQLQRSPGHLQGRHQHALVPPGRHLHALVPPGRHLQNDLFTQQTRISLGISQSDQGLHCPHEGTLGSQFPTINGHSED